MRITKEIIVIAVIILLLQIREIIEMGVVGIDIDRDTKDTLIRDQIVGSSYRLRVMEVEVEEVEVEEY